MKGFKCLGQMALADVGIAIGRRDIGMPKHLLDDAQVGAVFQKVGRKRVAQGMRRDFLIDSRGFRKELDPFPDQHPVDPLAFVCEE